MTLHLGDYEPLTGAETLERLYTKASKLHDFHIVHISSTYYGGGVATLLSSLTLLMNSVGLKTDWRIIQGTPDFFNVTKKIHNGLQGGECTLSKDEQDIYERTVHENAIRSHLDHHDTVIVHDPQPLPMIAYYQRENLWFWRCHVDLTKPYPPLWNYLKPCIERYDAMIVSLDKYMHPLRKPQFAFMPAIDPFSMTNRSLSDEKIAQALDEHNIPTDLPIIVQVARFDHWKDPQGVIDAFRIAREHVDATLVLLGNVATDDPGSKVVFESLLDQRDERIIILLNVDDTVVNAVQRQAAIVMQKSLREGFGLTVAEAMWKGKPVIGGNVGGICYQIQDGVNGFLVSSVDEAAARMIQLLQDEPLRRQMGDAARERVREKFLLTRYLEQYLDLFNTCELMERAYAT
jgi:trehalose synthase